jgi:hypothetical protein
MMIFQVLLVWDGIGKGGVKRVTDCRAIKDWDRKLEATST